MLLHAVWKRWKIKNWQALDRLLASLFRPDANDLIDRHDENLAVPDFPRSRGFDDGLYRGVNLIVSDDHLNLRFREEIHGIFTATIDFGVPLLPAETFDLGHAHALDADFLQGIL